MRILHVVDNYAPVPGGMEAAVGAVAAAQAAAGHEVSVLTLGRPDLPTRETLVGVPVHRVEGVTTRLLRRVGSGGEHQFHPTAPDPVITGALTREATAGRLADVVHAHGWIVADLLAARLPAGVLRVHTLHDFGLTCAAKTRLEADHPERTCPGPAARRCLRCASRTYGPIQGTALVAGLAEQRRRISRLDLALPISEAVRRLVLDPLPARLRPRRVAVVPSPVPDSVLAPPPPAGPEVPPGAIVYAGQLARHKGVDVLLEAHARMATALPLVLLGVGPLAPSGGAALTGTAQRPVHWLGRRSPEGVLAAFAVAGVVAVPSRWPEPMGLVAVEAMAMGAPVVASAVGGLGELVGPDVGRLVPAGDAAALARALDETLADDQLARRARIAGPLAARGLTAGPVAARLIEEYRG